MRGELFNFVGWGVSRDWPDKCLTRRISAVCIPFSRRTLANKSHSVCRNSCHRVRILDMRWRVTDLKSMRQFAVPTHGPRDIFAFTIIELLVMLGILGLLVAILTPALSAGRHAAH